DLKGFTRLIDAVGGLEVDVKRRTPIGGETSKVSGYIEPGRQVLDGYHALWYARSRAGSDNYERMARQRCVMDAMVHQLSPTTVVTKFQGIAAAGSEVVKTDIPESELGTLADLGLKAKGQKITSVNFVPPLMKPWNYDPDFVREKVASTLEASAAAPASPAPSASASGPGSPTTSAPAATSGAAATDDLSVVCST
ncbi:MAG TPA: LCP family protein, partial [Candidatus Lustribacter sp.]|nr:LCP family protein [Candidatus Lustribacter sp.]